MKIADILPQLTIQPLRRFGDAWGVTPITSGQRNVVEQAILGDLHRIDAEEAVRGRLTALEQKLDYVRRANAEMVLRLIVDQPGYIVADAFEFTRLVAERDLVFLDYARNSNALRHVDYRTVDICQSVLEVAWEDRVSYDESKLIRRLEEKLGVCRRDHLVMEARVSQRSPVTTQDVDEALKALTYEGFVCQFKHQGLAQVVLPEEIATHLRNILGVVLQSGAYRNLASKLSAGVLRKALESAGQPVVAPKKEVLIDRLVDGEISPSALLEQVDDKTLDDLLGQFPDEKRLTMRGVKIKHLISNFDRAYVKLLDSTPDDPDKTYYDYLEELASRRYDVLRAASVIKRDQNVDRFFERGVRYAFRAIFGHPAPEFTGSAHADGGVSARNGRMALWDCKSALTPYALTEAKCGQFLQYIAKEGNVVNPFMVISGSFTDDSATRAIRLQAMCPPGTNVGLLTAADLKWLAEKWEREYARKRLPLDVLAHTGLLSKDVLEFRLRTFAGKAEDKE